MFTYGRNSASRLIIAFYVSFSLCLLILVIHFTSKYFERYLHPDSSDLKNVVVCIDPGHPTEFNSGMHHVQGLREVDINWQVALKLRKELEAYGIRVVLTKNSVEQLVSNPRRSIIANEAGAVLMVRLHCDAGPAKGYTIYYPDKIGADRENYGPNRPVRVASRIAAYRIHSGMKRAFDGILEDRGVRGESRTRVGEWNGALRGSVYVKVPVVTIEMVFLTDWHDAEFIKTEWGQDAMADAIADGILLALDDPKLKIPSRKNVQAPIVH